MPEKSEKWEEPKEEPKATRGLDIPASETSWGFKGKNYLFTIGIDKYQYWPPLKCAVKDVRDFAKILTERYQFEEAYVFTLQNEEATEKNILHTFRQIQQKVTDQDNLVIYFSGHGHYDELTKTGYWIPVDAQTGYENEYQFINTVIIVDRLRGINSLHTFLIIDACFSGTLIAKIRSSPRSERYKSRRVFTSGRAEVVSDGPEGGNSPFARGILNHLTYNTNKYVPASKFIMDVMEYVEKEAQQTPTDARLINADDQGGDFVFHLKMSEAEIWADVVTRHTIEAYQNFIDQFPQSDHRFEAQEAKDWLIAYQNNTIESLRWYLTKYQPNGKYIPLAIKTMNVLEEEKCWQKAKERDTLSAYFDYLYRYSEGKYVEEARRKTSQMANDEDDKAFKKAIEAGTPAAYQNYLNKSGAKKHQEDAEKKLSNLSAQSSDTVEEEKAWEKVQEIHTYIAYHDFIQTYPESQFLELARQAIKRMDDVALNQLRILASKSNVSHQEKINRCTAYFNDFPGADNNASVKQIKEWLERLKYKKDH